jgi:uncharacterized protein YdeI (YjbR/CyaY-like superfamily)
MKMKKMSAGVVHGVPSDLQKLVGDDALAWAAWEDITPLARNEWICWVEDAKLPETRARRIGRVRSELIEGMRRPCCWAGCGHRKK